MIPLIISSRLSWRLKVTTTRSLLWLVLSVSLFAQENERVPWTSSRLAGSPEPPLPFTVERIFPKVDLPAPMYLIEEPGSDRLWVVLQGGERDKPAKIVGFPNHPEATESELVFELPGHLIYSMIFDPGYEENRLIYLFSNGPRANRNRNDQIDRYRVDKKNGFTDKLTIIEWKSGGHDGGDIAFGKDKMLYLTTGDGSNDSDGWNSGQTLDDLLGAVLRIDVRSSGAEHPYEVPPDNPFVEMEGARPEIYAYGLRNPWRMGIDQESGQIWVGNNGQDLWETAHLVRPGENYGWSVFEGSYPFYKNRQLGPTPHIAPTIEHHHAEFRSLTGGVVYRGTRWPELDGAYIYGDYSTGRIWGAKHDGNALVWHRELADTALMIASFRVIENALCVVDHAGGIYRLTNSAKPAQDADAFPRSLSETGLFQSTPEHTMAPGVISYTVNADGWHDGAIAKRWMAIPGKETITFTDGARAGEFPDGTALVQTLERDGVRIETRVQLRQQKEWMGYSYRWADDQKDAVLVPKGGEDVAEIDWRIPSRTECAACHGRAVNYVLGITGQQLDHADQLKRLTEQGLFSNGVPERRAAPLANPYDPNADIHKRIGAYLHTNCAICHVESGGGNAMMDLTLGVSPNRIKLIEARPQHATFGIDDAMLVYPGAPDRSVLVHRLSHRGSGQMPPLVSRRVDTEAVAMIREWIEGLSPSQAPVNEWTLSDFEGDLETSAHRPYHSGKNAFEKTGCAQCHQIAGSGGVVGPDLSNVGSMQSSRELLESVLLPSQSIKEERHRVPGVDPALSLMPVGMVNVLTKEEVLDLVAFLKSGGRPRVAAIVTEYRHNSHADVIVSRLFQTDTLDGKGKESPLRLASLYTDQVPDSDTSRQFSTQYDFPIFDSISDALTLGTGELAVDGVLLIAEHGDYPKSATGNTQFPKRRFWEEIVKVFERSNQVVPVFIDKHLADNWTDAKFIYDSAQQMKIPIMAGSSLPTTWRRPAVDIRRRANLKEMVTLTYGSTDAYGFHALELAQALAERRGRRGETGIEAVQALQGEAVWRAFAEEQFDLALFQAAWERLENPRGSHDLDALRKAVDKPLLFTLEYADGWKSHFLELNGAVGEWAAAWRYADDDSVESSLFWTQEGRPGMHFTWLLNGVEKMILTGEPSWNIERTLMTSGALDALLTSMHRGSERLVTPFLKDVQYRSRWRWNEPPPPPPMRPWSSQ
ncbi:MAG: glucose/arabinose dehydrogenase/cytochrome c553 [Verrucomicrobiales bacterium]|jgi:glucose/arabinose dehydrogenase/cytochrome c553